MALIKCTECGKEISDKAASCPHCGSPTLSAQSEPQAKPGDRKCLKCGFVGKMDTWLRNNIGPQFIFIFLLCIYVIPGLIFLAWGWGKYKCPRCGAVDNSAPAYKIPT